jgi:hypothetical protein
MSFSLTDKNLCELGIINPRNTLRTYFSLNTSFSRQRAAEMMIHNYAN